MKKRNEHPEELSSTLKKPKASIDLNSLNKLTKSEVATLLKNEIPLDDDDLSKIGNLKGLHLSTAVSAYTDEFSRQQDRVTSKKSMIESLMEDEKIIVKSVAEFVANWLVKEFVVIESVLVENKKETPITAGSIIEFILNQCINISDESTEQKIQKSSQILLNSFGAHFTFIGRKEPIEMINNNFLNYSTIRKNSKGQIDKSSISLPFIAAAPGIGKSRLLKEMGRELYKSTENHCFPLYLTFGNGCPLKEDERKFYSVEESLVLRMIFSLINFLCKNFPVFGVLKERFLNFLEGKKVINLLQHTLDAFKQILELYHEVKNIDTFYLAIDEVHEINTDKNEKELNPLRQLTSIIGGYMQGPYEINIFPLFAGTYHTVIHESLAAYLPNFIPMKAILPENEIYSILDQLAETNDKFLNWRTNCKFRHYLRTFGGFARGVEFYLNAFQERNSTPLSAWEASKHKLHSKYLTTSTINYNFLVFNILTRNMVEMIDIIPGTTRTFSDLENEGRIMLDPVKGKDGKFVAIYPTVLLYYLVPNELKEIFEDLFFNTERVYGTWEDIVHSYTFLNLHLLTGNENITLEQLFPYAEMTNTTRAMVLEKIPKVKMVYSEEKIEFTTPSTLKFKHNNEDCTAKMLANNKVEYNEKTIYVVKNGTSAQAGDVIILGLKLTSVNSLVVFHVHCKWTDAGKASLSMAEIDQEIEKNKKLKFQLKKDDTFFDCSTRNITVIITGKEVTNLTLTDDLIVINKTNFANFFGIFANQMKFLHH